MTQVILYSKPGCHLCEPVEQVIRAALATRRFEFSIRNILDDPQDLARYQNDIPVVTVDGIECARHRLSIHRLIYALDDAEMKSA